MNRSAKPEARDPGDASDPLVPWGIVRPEVESSDMALPPDGPSDVAGFLRDSAPPARDTAGASPGPPAAPAPLRRLGHFTIEAELGRGGMGIVYRARDERLRRIVALKVIVGEDSAPEWLHRFLREARAAARLRHPGIVPVYDVFESDGRHFFTMEYVDGRTLDRVLHQPEPHGFHRQGQGLDPREAAEIVARVAESIDYAHCQCELHLNLKPAYILNKRATRRPRVVDFGLAKDLTLTPEEARTWARLTRTGMMFGTPGYMSPEQASGQPETIGARSDVYSLGAVLYELLCGRTPFEWRSTQDFLRNVGTRDPVPPRRIDPGVPRDLEIICLKALERAPKDRYATAGALQRDLEAYLAREPIAARPLTTWQRTVRLGRRHRGPVAAGAAFLALVLFFAGYAAVIERQRDRARAEMARAQERQFAAELERGGAAAATGDDRPLRDALDRAILSLDEPGLRGLAETLRRTAVERLEARHGRLVDALGREVGSSFALEAEVDGRRERREGRLLAVDRRRLVLLPAGSDALTLPWKAVPPETYYALAARVLPPGTPQEHFDAGLHAFLLGRREEAVTALEAALADPSLSADAGRLLERLGVETEECRREREAGEEAERRRKAEAGAEARAAAEREARLRADLERARDDLAAWRFAAAAARLAEAPAAERAGAEAIAAWWSAISAGLDARCGRSVEIATADGRRASGKLLGWSAETRNLEYAPGGMAGARVPVALVDLATEAVLAWSEEAGISRDVAALCWGIGLESAGRRARALESVYGSGTEARELLAPWAVRFGLLARNAEGVWEAPGEAEWRASREAARREAEAAVARAAEAEARRKADAAAMAASRPTVSHPDLAFQGVNPQGHEEFEHRPSGIVLVLLPAGTFKMGSPDNEAGRYEDEPWRTVTFARPLLVGRTEVTNAQFRRWEAAHSSGKGLDGEDQPALVSWVAAEEFCARRGLRLLAESEWEYAARGGDGRVFPWGKDWPPPAGSGNYYDAAERRRVKGRAAAAGMAEYDDGAAGTAPVGGYAANPFGLHDLGGNVAEWCSDWHYEDGGAAAEEDPIAQNARRVREARGASWQSDGVRALRCAYRAGWPPGFPRPDVGFRVAMDVPR